jgi:hypothetical protein
MPDITMCDNLQCPLRASCYRYLAKPSEFWQAWCNFTPDKASDGGVVCAHYWKVEPGRRMVLALEQVDAANRVATEMTTPGV